MAEINQSRIFVKISGDGLSPGTVGWPELREFVDALIKAATALEPSLRAEHVAPVQIVKGSLGMAFKVPSEKVRPFERLKDGDHSTWTPDEVKATRPFFSLAERRQYRVSIKTPAARLRLVKAPVVPEVSTATYISETTLFGSVERAGGKEPTATIVFDRFGRRACVASRDAAMGLGKVLYQRVKVRGELTRLIETGDFDSFVVKSFEVLGRRLSPQEFEAAMANAVGESMNELDVEAFLKAVR
jgi:hypothetical protein